MRKDLLALLVVLSLCLLLPVAYPGVYEDVFCIGGVNTSRFNTSASVGYSYYCSGPDAVGLDDAFEINLSDGSTELNITVPPGGTNGSMTIRVPFSINLTEFWINLTGMVIDINEPKPVGAILVTDVSGSMSGGCGGCNTGSCTGTCNNCKMCGAKVAAWTFVNVIFNESQPAHIDTRIGLAEYTTHGYVDHCLTDNATLLNNSIGNYAPSSMTCISCGFNRSKALIDGYDLSTDKVVLLMTDGRANYCENNLGNGLRCPNNIDYRCSGWNCVDNIARQESENYGFILGDENVTVYVIGFGTGWAINEPSLRQIGLNVNASAGNTYGYYKHAPDVDSLIEIYTQIAREIAFDAPEDVYIDVGNNGTQEWFQGGQLGTDVQVDIADWLMWHVQNGCNCPSCSKYTDPVTGEEFCDIQVFIGSSTGGNITIDGVNAYASYSSGHVASIVVNGSTPTEPLKGWGNFCFTVDNEDDTNVTFRVLRGDHSVLTPVDCENCSTMSTITNDQTACFGLFDINVSGFNPTHNLTLYADLHSSNASQKPLALEWNVTYYGSGPVADSTGPYSSAVGQYVTLNATPSCENFTLCECCPPTCPHGCDEWDLDSTFNFWWTVSHTTSSWTWSSSDPIVQFYCNSPGDYLVLLIVENQTSHVKSLPHWTGITVSLPPADLFVEEVELVEPMIKDITSDTFVIVANEGGQGAGYNITLTVYNLTGDIIDQLIYQKSYNETILPSATLRNRGFSWVPPVKGDYLINATIYNLSDGNIIHSIVSRKVFVRELELKQAAVTGAEYPVMVLLVVLVTVPLLAFYLRKRKR